MEAIETNRTTEILMSAEEALEIFGEEARQEIMAATDENGSVTLITVNPR